MIALAFLIPATAQNPARKPASEPYVWKNVQMVGGGFVDGIIFHPTAKGVRYARTDMGGAYRLTPRPGAGNRCSIGWRTRNPT